MTENGAYCSTGFCRGGVLSSILTQQMLIVDSLFENNATMAYDTRFDSFGGAVYSEADKLEILHSTFRYNRAGHGGSLYVNQGQLDSSGNYYAENTAEGAGGAIYIRSHSFATFNDTFVANQANFGAGVWALASNSTVSSSDFIKNAAHYSGGAIFMCIMQNGSFQSVRDSFTRNAASLDNGGAVYVLLTENYKSKDHATDFTGFVKLPTLKSGHGVFSSILDTYTSNTARFASGGGMYAVGIYAYIEMTKFVTNYAFKRGTTISFIGGVVQANNSTFSYNLSNNDSSTVYISTGSFTSKGCEFRNNGGSVHLVNSVLEIDGQTVFDNNTGNIGGAITSIQSNIYFRPTADVKVTRNKALNGGGISLFESLLNISSSVTILENNATNFGGGIYAHLSEIVLPNREETVFGLVNNTAMSGGGSYLTASAIKVYLDTFSPRTKNTHRVLYSANRAQFGGALYLEQTSRIYLYRVLSARENAMRIIFVSNMAEHGGAMYVADNSAPSELCKGGTDDHYQVECFVQVLSLSAVATGRNEPFSHHTVMYFLKNTATKGNDIYGGLFDRCSLNPIAETLFANTKPSYAKAIAMMRFSANQAYVPSRAYLKDFVTSDPVQLCFCTDKDTFDCSVHEYRMPPVRRGETFRIKVTAVDHIQNQVSSAIFANSSIGTFKQEQSKQFVSSTCTELEYNLYSKEPELSIEIYADGPCESKGISKRRVQVTFAPCDCPIGFQSSDSETECVCECDSELEGNVQTCFVANETIQLSSNNWIGYLNTSNNSRYIIHPCPFDYCREKPINISLNVPNGADRQCAFNRSNLLCGECDGNLSLVFGSSKCKECTNQYLTLLIPFAVLGIALVAFILILNMTVATGTIHGLIFYANILATSQSIFYSGFGTGFLKVFIAWLNLDIGIETCFYSGMDSYAKVLLQLVFPAYLIFLTFMIIIICEYSRRFAALMGNRNPVATLCTLTLLSYSKLLRTIIAALQYTYLDYPDGSREIVWLYDANVPYFETSHVPRFIIAAIIVILGTLYTVLLFFGQWLPRLSNWKIMRWTKHPKYNAFIDAYHAPFSPKRRYWVGLLLFARIVHNITVALVSENSVTLLSIGCISVTLILLKSLHSRTYKSWALDFLENTFLINLLVLSLGTFYVGESNSAELPLVIVSTVVSFAVFVGILSHHIYKYFIKTKKCWKRIESRSQTRRQSTCSYSDRPLSPVLREEDNFNYAFPTSPNKDIDSYTNTGNTATQIQHLHDPPIIRSALITDNQTREPYLDILDPITADHYKEPNKKPPPSVPGPITRTIIEKPR